MTHRLHIRTLGSFLIEYNHQVIETFLTRKTMLLLAYLAMNPGKHAREKLAMLFWSETSDEQALKNLRTVLSNIRKNAPDAVRITRRTVHISESVWIDARHFEEGCDTVFAGNNQSLDSMMEIVALYTGEFLRDLHIRQADELQDWINNKRDQLHQKYLQLLYHIGEYCLEIGEIYTGVTVARQLVSLNPLWEAAHRQLMIMLARLGQTGEAQLQYERVVSLLDAELGIKPEQETVSLYESIRSGVVQDVKATLPRIVLPDLPYIPPKNDLSALRRMLDRSECRLMTLVGIGGVGKTMLATFTAHERQTVHGEEVVFIPLANVRDVQSLPQMILASLNVDVIKNAGAEDQLLGELRLRKMLLVLDNYEHLLPETDLVERILSEAPDVRVLVTSQVALNLRQEWLLYLNGLQIQEDEALQLFKKTVERILPHFDFLHYEDDIRQICTFLDGLPLGIVIAASQMKILSPPEILAALHSDISLFTMAHQDTPVRHRGFTHLIDSVLKQLDAEDQRALMALTIFPDSFGHEATLSVADMSTMTFIRLVDKSLIQRVENFRYRIHSILRQVFSERLAASGEKECVRQRLTAYYVQWCLNLYQQKKQRHDEILVIDIEHVNIWHLDLMNEYEQQRYLMEIIPALQKYWRNRGFGERVTQILLPALDDDDHPAALRARTMVELANLLVKTGKQQLVQDLCERALVTAPDVLYVQVDALQNLARLNMQRGDYQQAWQQLMSILEMEALLPGSDDPMLDYLLIGNHTGMGLAAMHLGEIEIARSHFNIALHRWTQMDEPLMQAQVRNNLALLDMREGRYDSARQYFEAIIPSFHDVGDDNLLATTNGNLGRALMMLGHYAQAHDRLTEAIMLAVRLERRVSVLYQLETFTQLAFLTRQYTIAAQLYGYILKRSEEDNIAFWSNTLQRMEDYQVEMSSILGPHFEGLVNLGSKLSQDSAIALAATLSGYLPSTDKES